jgi:hypothetical protein
MFQFGEQFARVQNSMDIADVQQKWESEALVENILDRLDTSAYSNKELSQILDTDKQQFPENCIS